MCAEANQHNVSCEMFVGSHYSVWNWWKLVLSYFIVDYRKQWSEQQNLHLAHFQDSLEVMQTITAWDRARWTVSATDIDRANWVSLVLFWLIEFYSCQKVTSLHDNGVEKNPQNHIQQTLLSLCYLCFTCVYTYFGLIIKFSGLPVQVLAAVMWKNSSSSQKIYLPKESFILNGVSLNRCWQTEITKMNASPITFHEVSSIRIL